MSAAGRIDSFAAWAGALSAVSAGDDAPLAALADATVEWGPGVAAHFAGAVHDAMRARLEKLRTDLERETVRATTAAALGAALARTRAPVRALGTLVSLPSIPPTVRDRLKQELVSALDAMSDSLDVAAAARGRAADPLRAIIRVHRLSQPLYDAPTAPMTASSGTEAGAPVRRRIILS